MIIMLYGVEVSYFIGKVCVYLCWVGIFFEEVFFIVDVYWNVIVLVVGVLVILVLCVVDGCMLQDSIVIIEMLDQVQWCDGVMLFVYLVMLLCKLVFLMLEVYGDEWLVILVMYYCWYYDSEWVMVQFGVMNVFDEMLEN